MPGKKNFEAQLAALDELRRGEPEAAIAPLRKALARKSNYIAAKAADLLRELRLTIVLPELLAAYGAFFTDPEKSDPQCWAKNAISHALAALEWQEPEPFLRGIRHHQYEPEWGGRSDTAGTLRATCALALVQCRGLGEGELLRYLIDLLTDKETPVRVEAVRAIEQVGSSSADLLLRLKALQGDKEPEVLGASFGAVLRLEGKGAIPWVARFLNPEDETAAEAALAIAATRSAEAFEVLCACYARARDAWFRSVLLSAMALTRQEAAVEFLLERLRTDAREAEAALDALLQSRPGPEVTNRIEQVVTGNASLMARLPRSPEVTRAHCFTVASRRKS